MSGIVGVQRRMMELGRIRLGGEKAANAPGRKLTTFRLTSASRALLEAAAALYGGTVTEWEGANDEGYFQLYTETSTLDIILPPVFSDRDGSPTLPYSQAYELYKGPERQRCCDGVTESLSGKPCMCNADDRECSITTRLNVMLPRVPGLGVWLLQSHGWNAAAILPGTLDLLLMAAAESSFIPAVLRLEQRTSKKNGTTRKFVVPVIDLPSMRLDELAAASGLPALVNGPLPKGARPELPAAPGPPADASFENGTMPAFGERPPLPVSGPEPEAELPPGITAPQKKMLNVLVGQLRDAGHITTEQLYSVVADPRGVDPAAMCDEINGRDDEGVVHWSPLRDSLSKDEATGLIDRLERFAANLESEAAA